MRSKTSIHPSGSTFHMTNDGRVVEDTPRKRADGLLDYDEAYIRANSYSVNSMVLREIGMDEHTRADGCQYDDRIMSHHGIDEYREVCKAAWGKGEMGCGHWARQASDENVLKFATELAVLVRFGNLGQKVVGFRIVRCTNVSSGFPCYFFAWKLGDA